MNSFIEKLKNSKELQQKLDNAAFEAIEEVAKQNGISVTKKDLDKVYTKSSESDLSCTSVAWTAICSM